MFVLCLLFALCLARAQYLAGKFNMRAKWNGYGAIESIQNKTADAPMAYRVLIPWLIGKPTLAKYEAFQIALITAALYSVYLAWGVPVMLVAGLLLTITFFYDYWDWTPEMIGLSLALVSFPAAMLGVVLHGMSRETAPLVGVAYALHSGDWLGGVVIAYAGFAVLWMVRKIQGKHPLYCDRWMITRNWKELKAGKPASLISVGVSALALVGAWTRIDGLVVPVLLVAGWTMAVSSETRVFSAVLPYAAAFLVGVM